MPPSCAPDGAMEPKEERAGWVTEKTKSGGLQAAESQRTQTSGTLCGCPKHLMQKQQENLSPAAKAVVALSPVVHHLI